MKLTTTENIHHHYRDYYWPYRYTYLGGNYQEMQPSISQPSITWTCNSGGIAGSSGTGISCETTPTSSLGGGGILRSMNCSAPAAESGSSSAFNMADARMNDAGITVPGSESRQEFETGAWFPTEAESHVIVLRLRGAIGAKPVERPVTTDIKPKCTSCGRKNKATAKFCSQCGTSLVLI